MDLNAAKDMNSTTWKGFRLVAILFFAVAGALLLASLVTPSGVRAEAGLDFNDAPLRFAAQM